MAHSLSQEHRNLIKELQQQGIRDEAVLKAMLTVPREEFVPEEVREFAYRNAPLPIGLGQTISQPFVVAHMAEALRIQPTDRLLEVGTGSGYAAAVLAEIAGTIYTIERHRALAQSAAERLKQLGYHHVHVRCGDGTLGWLEQAPFDGIVAAASGPSVPPALLQQLRPGGRLVMPVGSEDAGQKLLRVTRRGPNEYIQESLGAVRFVPLIGEGGWPAIPGSTMPRARPDCESEQGSSPPSNPLP